MTRNEAIDKQNVFIRNARRLAKDTGKIGQLEDALCVQRGYLSRFDKGTKFFSLAHALMICDHFEMTFEDLCDEGLLRKKELEEIDDQIVRLMKRKRELEEEE